jgi:hypothetical protein
MAPSTKDHGNGAPKKKDVPAEETATLLYSPSPGSTNRPSLTNVLDYGAVESGVEQEPLIQMSLSQTSLSHHAAALYGDDEWPQTTVHKKRNQKGLVYAAMVPVLLVAALLIFLGVRTWTVPNSHPSHDGTGIPNTSTGKTATGLPFSKNHPVHDLKLEAFQRPEASAPDAHLFASSNTATQKPKAALPTNSWYQNILLARGEPTEEQRVYPVPYLVDMVGPIPGLRVHHSTVDAGNNVIQLTQILEHGLTLGAASTRMILDKDDDKKNPISKKFQVTTMTQLGVTLQWVSFVKSKCRAR